MKIFAIITNLFEAAGHLLWPPVCAACSRRLPAPPDPLNPADLSGHFCPDCLVSLELMPPEICPICGRPFFTGPGHVCGDCLIRPPRFGRARAAGAYAGSLARSIGHLKYRGGLGQLSTLAALSRPYLAPALLPFEFDLIAPMPLSPKRLARRGYNQSAELAKAVYGPWRELRPMIDERVLRRVHDGPAAQAGLSARERRLAIRGSFAAEPAARLAGRRVLLFDDVLTTGATAGEAAKVLLAAGAAEVNLVTVARTLHSSWRRGGA